MHYKSDKIEIVIDNETNEITEELFGSLLQRNKKGLEESMKDIKIVFDILDLLHYKRYKISLNRGESDKDFPKWLKSRKVTKTLKIMTINVFNML